MSKRGDKEFLRDILEASGRIAIYTQGMSYDEFLKDTKTQDAVMRNLEIVGEATKKLTGELREKYEDLPWREMAGVRDRLIHHYFGVNLDIVWQISVSDLPAAVKKIEEIVRRETSAKN